jgi:hypothetical protein
MNEFLEVLSKHFDELNASMGATPRARPALPDGTRKQSPPSAKKANYFDVPHGIVAHLTRECGRNVHDRHAVDVTSGLFEKETVGANPNSVALTTILIVLRKTLPTWTLSRGSLQHFFPMKRLPQEEKLAVPRFQEEREFAQKVALSFTDRCGV